MNGVRLTAYLAGRRYGIEHPETVASPVALRLACPFAKVGPLGLRTGERGRRRAWLDGAEEVATLPPVRESVHGSA